MTRACPPQRDAQTPRTGERVRLRGLTSHPGLNGVAATVTGHKGDRVVVKTDAGGTVRPLPREPCLSAARQTIPAGRITGRSGGWGV